MLIRVFEKSATASGGLEFASVIYNKATPMYRPHTLPSSPGIAVEDGVFDAFCPSDPRLMCTVHPSARCPAQGRA